MVGGHRTACLVVVSGPGVSVPRTRAPLRRQFPPNQYTDADKESHADNQRWRERGEILQHRGHLARRSKLTYLALYPPVRVPGRRHPRRRALEPGSRQETVSPGAVLREFTQPPM